MDGTESGAGGSGVEGGLARRPFAWAILAVVILGLFGVAGVTGRATIGRALDRFSDRVESLGPWGPLAFGLAYAAAIVAMIPALPFTIVAGALFGPTVGGLTAWLAANLGAAAAFLLARGLARGVVERRARDDPRFDAIDRGLAAEGWKVLALLRLSPAVPFVLLNYACGLTGISFRAYALTSAVAILPGTALYIYLGHAGRVGLEAAGASQSRTPAEWAMLGLGLLATIGATALVARLARRSFGASEGSR